MKRVLLSVLMLAAVVASAQGLAPSLDSVYGCYATRNYQAAAGLLDRLDRTAVSPADRFLVKLEIGDFLLDKENEYAKAESVYNLILAEFPKEKRRPDVIYRLALAQEMQEKFLDAAKNYEQVATKYMKSAYGQDALDAIERCFRKNYQDRVAYVNGFPITRIELDEHISQYPAAYEKFEQKQQLLDTMIDDRLMFEAAVAAGVMKDPELVKSLSQLRNRFVFEEWYDREVNARAEPSDKVLQAQYKKDRAAKYSTPEKVHGYEIVVAARSLADSLRAALLSDTALRWDSVAVKFSTAPDKDRGGDMGLFARGVQPKPVEAAAFSLKPGQISPPIKTDQGFVIIKVTEKKPATVKPFSEVKNQMLVELRQDNVNKLYEQKTEVLKSKAKIVSESTAIAEDKDTLASVDGYVITRAALQDRIEQIPPFYRSQFQSPEGKQRILDQLVLEYLILRDAEAKKTWLWNKVVDRVLAQRAQLAISRYRGMTISAKVKIDSGAVRADYKASIKDYEVPAQVHVREIVTTSFGRTSEIRGWAKAGRLPKMIEGRGLLVPDKARVAELKQSLKTATNTDSLIALYGLAGPPALPGTPTIRTQTREVPNIAERFRAAGPYRNTEEYGFGFADLSAEDGLFAPELKRAQTADELAELLGEKPKTDSAGAVVVDSGHLGTYITLDTPLPASFVKRLFKLNSGDVGEYELPQGILLVKVTKKDTAQKTTFADLARRFSVVASKWSGGDLNWLNRDDKAHDEKLVSAAFSLDSGAVSQVMELSDSAYAFVKTEEKKKAYTQPFDSVQAKIADGMRRTQTQELDKKLIQDLHGKASIEILMKESDFNFEPEPGQETPGQEEPAPGQPEK